MNRKLDTATLSVSLLLFLAVLACPQTVSAQTDGGVQYSSGVHLFSPLTNEISNQTLTSPSQSPVPVDEQAITPTMQAPAENVTQNQTQNKPPPEQIPIMIIIVVVAFAAYIAVIAVLASRKTK